MTAFLKKHAALIVAALLLLPVMAVATSYAYAALGALPDVRFTGAQIEALSWLPVVSLYAGAAIVMAVFFVNTFMCEPDRATEAEWHALALAGNRHAKWLLIRNDIRWYVVIAMAGAFFWGAR